MVVVVVVVVVVDVVDVVVYYAEYKVPSFSIFFILILGAFTGTRGERIASENVFN